MTRNLAIANRLREVLLNGKWIANTNFKEQILSVSWEQAIQKVGNLNTIALLTFHINYYLAGLLNVFAGGKLEIKDKYSFDLPAISSQQDWENLLEKNWVDAATFATLVEQLPEEKLWETFSEEKYGNYYRNLTGIIEHTHYHLGQIVLIKKMLQQEKFY